MRVWIALIAVAFLFGTLGTWVARQKRRGGAEGFILGLLFGPLGCLIEALLPAGERPVMPRWSDSGRRTYAVDEKWPGEMPDEWGG